MNIQLIAEQIGRILLTLETQDSFEVYGGTWLGAFEVTQTGTAQWTLTVREKEVAAAPLRDYKVYARQLATGREWEVLSGKILVSARTAAVPADKLAPVEYFVTVPVVDHEVDAVGSTIVQGIPGPQGPKGDKGDPGEPGKDGESAELTPEAIQQVVPIAWSSPSYKANTNSNQSSIAIGSNAYAINYYAYSFGAFSSAGQGSVALGFNSLTNNYCVSIGYKVKAKSQNLGISIGAEFVENTDRGNVTHTCTTEGTGSITIGAGANTLNNGDTESSNSVTIGCKALNQGADSVVIGAQASGKHASVTCVGASSSAGIYGVAVGKGSQGGNRGVSIGNNSYSYDYSIAIGYGATNAPGKARQVAIGANAVSADYGAVVFRSTAEDGTYTQLYFSGANTPLANTYENGEAMMGYVVRDSAGNVMVDAEGNAMVGTQKLSVLFPNNRGENAFTPAMLGLDDEYTPKPMFRPSDLDLPTEEPAEEEYQPLPVWPIVEPDGPEDLPPHGKVAKS